MADRQGLVFRQDYYDEPDGWAAMKSLLVDIFDVDLSPLDALGGHDRTSMPSAYFDPSGVCVANLSAFSMPLIINGRRVEAAGWQSGAVRPAYRGRGLYSDLMSATLERCEQQRFEAMVLYTDKPELYEPLGFRIVPQYSFRGPTPRSTAPVLYSRELDVGTDSDLIRQLLRRRRPVSDRLAVVDQAQLFLLNAILDEGVRLSLIEERGAVIAWRMTDDGVFELLDVVAAEIPALADIVSALGVTAASIESFIPPDLLLWQPEAVVEPGPLVFMMRGADDLMPSEPSCLSPMASF